MKVLWKKLRIAALICCVTFLFMGTAFASPAGAGFERHI